MTTTLKLAWRNLWRNRRRTLINMSAVGLGLVLVIFYSGLVGGMMSDAKNQMANTGMGHVEIYAPQFRARQSAAAFMTDPRAILAKLQLPSGARASARVVARGLVSSAHGGRGVLVHGVDPAIEPTVASYMADIREGQPLVTGDDHGILIGDKLAERLKVRVGQKVRLMTQRVDTEMDADIFRVRGIYHSIASGISQSRVIVTAAAAQRLLGIPDAAHQIIIQLPRAEDAEAVATALKASLGPGFDVVTYGELLPVLKSLEKTIDLVMVVIAIFVYLLVGLGILNTMLMSVLERTRELGVMQAVGTRPRGVRRLILAEAFWVATVSVAGGLALGLFLTHLGSTHSLLGFMYSSVGESMELGGALIRTAFYTQFSWGAGVRAAALVYGITLIVGLYPAWRVSRMLPADALRAV